ncbi:hypothetical protein ACFLZ0_01505 [Patescibacteria group bacterium]
MKSICLFSDNDISCYLANLFDLLGLHSYISAKNKEDFETKDIPSLCLHFNQVIFTEKIVDSFPGREEVADIFRKIREINNNIEIVALSHWDDTYGMDDDSLIKVNKETSIQEKCEKIIEKLTKSY